MVRIAFVMDRVFRHFGLSGKSFIPLLISSGCGIPGIMASKTIEQDNDRRLTIMTATFVPCGAKLPVIALMGGVMAGYVTGWDIAGFNHPAHVLCRYRCSISCSDHVKEDQAVLRQAGSVRYGAAAVPHPVCKNCASACMGETEGLLHQGRYSSVPGLRSDVDLKHLRCSGWRIWYG